VGVVEVVDCAAWDEERIAGADVDRNVCVPKIRFRL